MNPEIEKCAERMEGMFPVLFQAGYPRRIVPPNGYANPKWMACQICAQVIATTMKGVGNNPQANALFAAIRLLQFKVPTYFVDREFATAVARTTPPEGMPLSEIKWPMEAMLFVLPDDFQRAYFGQRIPFIAVTHAIKGVYPRDVMKDLPELDIPWRELASVENGIDRFLVWYPWYYRNTLAIDYTGAYHMDQNVESLKTTHWYEDIDEESTAKYEKLYGPEPDKELEDEISVKVNAFAISLLMAMTAQPMLVEQGTQLRPASVKKGKPRDALWGPNVIGRGYRILREEPTEGHHASPRMHWRRGHFRQQRCGLGFTETRVIWIEPCLVNKPKET